MRSDLCDQRFCQKVVGEAAHLVAVIHQRPQELVEQLAPPLHIVLRSHAAMSSHGYMLRHKHAGTLRCFRLMCQAQSFEGMVALHTPSLQW